MSPDERLAVIERLGTTTVVRFSGETKHSQVLNHQLDELRDAILKGNSRLVLVDLSQTSFISSIFLSFVVQIHQRLRQVGGQLVLCGVSGYTADILQVAQLNKLFTCTSETADAILSNRGPSIASALGLGGAVLHELVQASEINRRAEVRYMSPEDGFLFETADTREGINSPTESNKSNPPTKSAVNPPAEWPSATSSRGEFREDDEGDSVDCTVFAPSESRPGDSVLVQVWAHLPDSANEAAEKATRFDDEARERGSVSLGTRVHRGSTLTFRLVVPNMEIERRKARLVWQGGAPQAVQFTLIVPGNFGQNVVTGTVYVSQDGAPIGVISFKLKIVERTEVPGEAGPIGSARRFTSAFLSYSSSDLLEVLRQSQVLKGVGVKVLQDVLSIGPGDRWALKLYTLIDQCDVFFLFWSTSAKRSEWVEKEWRYCLEHKGDQHVCPVVIEGPPIPLPPPELEHLQFGDALLRMTREPIWKRVLRWIRMRLTKRLL